MTKGRPWKMQTTAQMFEDAQVPYRFVRTKGDEIELPRGDKKTITCNTKTAPEKRQYVLENNNNFILCDDDVSLLKVKKSGKTQKASGEQVQKAMKLMKNHLKENAVVAFAERFMIQNKPQPSTDYPGGLFHIVGVNKDLLSSHIKYDRVRIHADLDFSLQVLTSGDPFLIITKYCKSSVGIFNRKGGVATYRTDKMFVEDAEFIRDQWPDIVQLKKDEKQGVKFRIAWRKIRDMRERIIHSVGS